ncbi:LysR family transcriptional regulator [Neobacillus niacini]|uniref:LysR family transcriptional regulator n=1 Tax=Neobacillus niacini TaxID=86668 RepID=UPI0028542720|nr:LysR family transcriptional regulator [Neobacillus niacini]MDR6999925.1 LysR family transcriptional repressor of citA [Neobacillus niacini]
MKRAVIEMDIKWLKTFIVAARYENFRKASEELFLTQPAVTKHVKRLEEYLHISLFERSGKNVSLTPAGSRFLSSAIKILKKYEDEMEEFEGWKQGYNRKLTIAVAPQIAVSILPLFLRIFMEQHPNIEVMINVVRSFEIGKEISLGKADIGLSRMKPIQTDLSCERIHRDPVILVAPNLEEKKQHKTNLNEENVLQQFRLLTDNHPAYWDTLLSEIKKYYPKIRTIPVTQMEITKRFIETGLGVSYLPLSVVQEELRHRRMVEIKPDKIVPPVSFTYVVTKLEIQETGEFITSLKNWMKELK